MRVEWPGRDALTTLMQRHKISDIEAAGGVSGIACVLHSSENGLT